MPNAEKPVVFVSYSHKDQHWLDLLRPHLEQLERVGVLEVWHDLKLTGGQHWY